MNAAGSFEEKKQATLGCGLCNGNPPLLNQSSSSEEVLQRIVGQIENIVRQQNAGTLDLNTLEYWEWKLLEVWRETEQSHERRFKIHTKLIFEALTRQS